ncbi:DUF664 domain-containing protein [Streptomyces sp. SID10853]|uniref:mycothiol transferase n=1 Tax=Streptomyces sp. SID10853 TaxID=2706028 RepID=UPI001EF1D4D3|nr:DUF664 domain-containing protein [Streptomyces sp. SID10853]
MDASGLRATLGTSTVTLGGLLKHLAHVEDSHFARLWLGSPVGAPWDSVDWDSTPDWDYRSAAEGTPEQLRALWQESVGRHLVSDLPTHPPSPGHAQETASAGLGPGSCVIRQLDREP